METPGALPLAIMCDLDCLSNHGFFARRNLFREHPQIGGRVKSSGALIEGNTFRDNVVLNQEVHFLQSSKAQPTFATCPSATTPTRTARL